MKVFVIIGHSQITNSCRKSCSVATKYFSRHSKHQTPHIKMKQTHLFLTMLILTFTCISSRHLFFFSEATNIQRKVSLISHHTSTAIPSTPTTSPNSSEGNNKTDKLKKLSHHLSMAAESGLTFISVFIFGCVIIASVYSWKKVSESSWG